MAIIRVLLFRFLHWPLEFSLVICDLLNPPWLFRGWTTGAWHIGYGRGPVPPPPPSGGVGCAHGSPEPSRKGRKWQGKVSYYLALIVTPSSFIYTLVWGNEGSHSQCLIWRVRRGLLLSGCLSEGFSYPALSWLSLLAPSSQISLLPAEKENRKRGSSSVQG